MKTTEKITRKEVVGFMTLIMVLIALALIVNFILVFTGVTTKVQGMATLIFMLKMTIPLAIIGLIADYRRTLRQLAVYGLCILLAFVPNAMKKITRVIIKLEADKSI
jgi:uncharacterized membrane protein YdjX (TVP38/TMEM64 family)